MVKFESEVMMKKKLAALMAIAVLSMSSVYAAETQGPVSRWLDNLTSKYQKKNSQLIKNSKRNSKSLQQRKKLENKDLQKNVPKLNKDN